MCHRLSFMCRQEFRNRQITLTSTFLKKWSKNFALNKHYGKFRSRHSFLLVRAEKARL